MKSCFMYLFNGAAFIGGLCIALLGFSSWVNTIYLLSNPIELASVENPWVAVLLFGDFSFVMLIVFYILSWKNQQGEVS